MQTLLCGLRSLALVLLVCLALGWACWGQLQTGLTGEVTDSSHAVISGAQVTVRNTNTGISSTVGTNAAGIYTFPVLAAGEYELTCEMTGFKRYFQRGVT